MITITVNIDPIPQSRPRFGKGKIYETPALKKYKAEISMAARLSMAGLNPLAGSLRCSIKFYRKFKATSRRFGDFDNLAKAVTDALNHIAFVDDSQITFCTIEKIQSLEPHIEIGLEEYVHSA